MLHHSDVSHRKKRGRKQAQQEKLVESLCSPLHKTKSTDFISFARSVCGPDLCSPFCLLLHCSLALETTQLCLFSVLQLEYQHPALCKECSRFRKITRGEWLTHSPCYVTRGSYQITVDSRLGETAAVFRSSWLEQTRNWD